MKELSFLTVSRSSAFLALAGASLALLAACGDDVTEVNQNGIEMISTVSAEKCTEADNGRTVFASVENSLFACSKGEWQDLSGADGVNGTDGISGTSCKVAKATADSMWFKCGDQTTVVELPAGVAGKVGAAGADGESCKVSKMSADSVWFKCGDQVTGMELPEGAKGATGATGAEGAKGEKGDKGDDGASCEIARVANDSLWFKCGDKLTGVELPEGAKGATGAAGAAGAKGDKGETGAAGTSCEISKTTSDSLWFKCGDQEKSIPLPKGSVDPAEAEQLQKVYQKKVYLQKVIEEFNIDFSNIKWPYATAWIEELDPKTMMPTGKSFSFQAGLDADKDASFEKSNLMFKTYSADVSVTNILSPLVRVRVELGYMNYDVYDSENGSHLWRQIPAHSLYAVTNLEDETSVYVSLASDLKSARVQKLVADGKTYEEANEQANTEIYDAFGLDDETVAAKKLINCYDESESAIKNNVETFDLLKNYNAKTYVDYQEGCHSLFAWIDLGVFADESNVDKVSGWNAARKIFAETGSLTGNLNMVENSRKLEPQIFADLYFDGAAFPASLVVEKYLTFKDDNGDEVVCTGETEGKLAQLATESSLYYGVWFGCNGYEWQKTPVETKIGCSPGSDNAHKTIKYGDTYYTCYPDEGWKSASDAEIYVSTLPTCSSETDGAYDYSDDFGYSICKKIDESWVWVSTAADFVNIYNAKCDASKDGQLVTEGLPLSELPVVCDKNEPYYARLASASEIALKKACLEDGETTEVNGREFTCGIDSERDIHTWRGTVDFNRNIQIDGNHSAVKEPSYNTVVIDTLEWMTDDLNYEPENKANDESNGIRCVNPSSSASVCSYRLYTWEASQQEGVCPEDWRIPTEDEFQKLYDAAANLGGCVWSPGNALTPCVGNALKSSSGWNSSELHGWQYRGSDYLGFNASGSGYYYADMQIGGYAAASWGGRTNYWTATKGKTFYIEGRDGAKFRDAEDGDPFYSVRCVRTFKVN